jgi:hypothetical protein
LSLIGHPEQAVKPNQKTILNHTVNLQVDVVYAGFSATTHRTKKKTRLLATTCAARTDNRTKPENKPNQPIQPHEEVVTHGNTPQQQLNKKTNP